MTDSRRSDARVRASAITAGSPATASAATSIRSQLPLRRCLSQVSASIIPRFQWTAAIRRDVPRTRVRARAQYEAPADHVAVDRRVRGNVGDERPPAGIGQYERARVVGRGRRLAGIAGAIVVGVGADLRVLIVGRDGGSRSMSRCANQVAARDDSVDLANSLRSCLAADVDWHPRGRNRQQEQ